MTFVAPHTLTGLAPILAAGAGHQVVDARGWPAVDEPRVVRATAGSHKIEGIGLGFLPSLWHPEEVTEILTVSTEDAKAMARRRHRNSAIELDVLNGCLWHQVWQSAGTVPHLEIEGAIALEVEILGNNAEVLAASVHVAVTGD